MSCTRNVLGSDVLTKTYQDQKFASELKHIINPQKNFLFVTSKSKYEIEIAGLDFDHVSMVGILNADNMLSPGPNTAFASATSGASANSPLTGAIGSVMAKPIHPYQQYIDKAEDSINAGPGSMLVSDSRNTHSNKPVWPATSSDEVLAVQSPAGTPGNTHVHDKSDVPAVQDIVEKWHPSDD